MSKVPNFYLKNYITDRLIKEGQNGRVYLVHHKETNQKMCVKMLKHEYITENEQDLFIDKIIDFLKLKNPTILSLAKFSLMNSNNKNCPLLITKYMPNGTLEDIFNKQQQNKLPSKFTNSCKYIILIGISLGLKYLHSKGIVHRDLKPSHILLDDNFYPHIINFDYCSISNIENEPKIEHSNLTYVAPETVSSGNYSYKSDVYSFSLIAYQLITGKTTFSKPPDYSIIHDDKIRNFISMCLSSNPLLRPSFDDIVDEIINQHAYREYFGADERQVVQYLNLFDNYKEKSFTMKKETMNNQPKENASKSNDNKNAKECTESSKASNEKPIKKNCEKLSCIQILKNYADHGNLNSVVLYAYFISYVKGIKNNKKEGAKYYKIAADLGDLNSINIYGRILLNGRIVPKNPKEAAKYFKIGADKGNIESIINYYLMLRQGYGIPADLNKSVHYIKKAVDKGDTFSMYVYGVSLFNGEGISKNFNEGIKYIKKSADLGNLYAISEYGLMLMQGNGVEMNANEAIKYFKIGIEKGESYSILRYGVMLFEGIGIKKNKKEAHKYIKLAAEKGNIHAKLFYENLNRLMSRCPMDAPHQRFDDIFELPVPNLRIEALLNDMSSLLHK